MKVFGLGLKGWGCTAYLVAHDLALVYVEGMWWSGYLDLFVEGVRHGK